jgi:predicted dehydrogenase
MRFLAFLFALGMIGAHCSVLAQNLHPEKIRLGIAGLAHGHAGGFFRTALSRSDIDIVGISESDPKTVDSYLKRFALDKSRIFPTHAEMMDRTKPEAIMIFSSTFEHKEIVLLAAERKIPTMMEKPLAVSMEHAAAIAAAAKRSGIPVMVNYETTWYPVNTPIWKMAVEEKQLGEIRRIVTHYGHQGPKEIGVGPEFLSWLTDPRLNGAGALFDFGCYGINFANWLLNNERPISVLATTRTNKPNIYPKVDDEATIVVQYDKRQLIIQPSWNWPFSRKDMEVYGETGHLTTTNRSDYRFRVKTQKADQSAVADALEVPDDDVIHYLAAVVRGKRKPDGLSGLENNLLVTEVLEAARESARTGKAVRLK